jgi:toxin ParE1/3/4
VTEHVFRAAAAADIERSYAWYERERVGLGEEFLQELSVTVDTILAQPRAYPVLQADAALRRG